MLLQPVNSMLNVAVIPAPICTFFNAALLENAESPMEVSVSGMMTSVSGTPRPKAKVPMDSRRSPKSMSVSAAHE